MIYIYMYIYIYVCVCVCVWIDIYDARAVIDNIMKNGNGGLCEWYISHIAKILRKAMNHTIPLPTKSKL